MFRRLSWKLTLAFLAIAVTTAALIAVSIRLTSANQLSQLILDQGISSYKTALANYYTTNGSWDGVSSIWSSLTTRTFPTSIAQSTQSIPSGDHRPGSLDQHSFFGLADAQGVVLVSVDPQNPVGSTLSPDAIKGGAAITVGGVQVGTLMFPVQPPGFNSQENDYLQRTSNALIFASLGAVLVAILLGLLLARTLTNPLKALTQAAHRISQGKLEQQVKVKSNDEIGQLATAFNLMSQEVAHENQLRRQMTADIAHDLRTPLTVISGYVESMRDGVLKPTNQRLELIYSEIERLQNLVGDLRMLSLADAGELSLNPQQMPVKALLDHAAALFKHQAGQQNVTINVDAGEGLPELRVDEARMMQVFGNLITNSLRYTPAGGAITLSARTASGEVKIYVQDTGTGIDPEELPYIFERFHRADKSRNTENGESGLGLAIVKALVESHGGTTAAESTPGQGTKIILTLPASKP